MIESLAEKIKHIPNLLLGFKRGADRFFSRVEEELTPFLTPDRPNTTPPGFRRFEELDDSNDVEAWRDLLGRSEEQRPRNPYLK